MAVRTYPLRALVLRRTKLGESDVIVTLLSSQGSQVRAVAKGARKPTSSFASRLEVYAECDLLLSQGKTLDLVKEARLVQAHEYLRTTLDPMQAAAPMVELLDRTTQAGLEDDRLYDMTSTALSALEGLDEERLSSITAAHLLKTLAMLGFLPRFDMCVCCGEHQDLASMGDRIAFSLIDGGIVCSRCRTDSETILFERQVLMWAQALLFSPFSEIREMPLENRIVFEILRFLQLWVKQHIGVNLKSLSFLIAQS